LLCTESRFSGADGVIRLNVLYVTAFGVAAAMMTLIVFSVRQLLPSHTGIPPLAAGLLFVYLAACDMRLGPLRTPGLWRQTCPAWRAQWRAGIAHRRFAANAIYLQAVSPERQRHEPGEGASQVKKGG